MSDEKMPTSIAQSEITIGGITLVCHVLDDGRRVIEGDGMDDLLAAMMRGTLSEKDALDLAAWTQEAGYGRRN